MLCLSSLYFFALKSVGKGSVPQIIYTLEIVIVCSPQQLCLWSGGHLEHVLVEVLLLFLIVPEPLENELTEVRKIYETLPAIILYSRDWSFKQRFAEISQ